MQRLAQAHTVQMFLSNYTAFIIVLILYIYNLLFYIFLYIYRNKCTAKICTYKYMCNIFFGFGKTVVCLSHIGSLLFALASYNFQQHNYILFRMIYILFWRIYIFVLSKHALGTFTAWGYLLSIELVKNTVSQLLAGKVPIPFEFLFCSFSGCFSNWWYILSHSLGEMVCFFPLPCFVEIPLVYKKIYGNNRGQEKFKELREIYQ